METKWAPYCIGLNLPQGCKCQTHKEMSQPHRCGISCCCHMLVSHCSCCCPAVCHLRRHTHAGIQLVPALYLHGARRPRAAATVSSWVSWGAHFMRKAFCKGNCEKSPENRDSKAADWFSININFSSTRVIKQPNVLIHMYNQPFPTTLRSFYLLIKGEAFN